MSDGYPIEISDFSGTEIWPEDLAAGIAYTYHLRAWDQDRIVMSNDNAERIAEMTDPSRNYTGYDRGEPNRHERRRAAKRARSGR